MQDKFPFSLSHVVARGEKCWSSCALFGSFKKKAWKNYEPKLLSVLNWPKKKKTKEKYKMRSAWWPCTQYATAAVYFWFSVSCLFSILFSLKHLLTNSFASRHSFPSYDFYSWISVDWYDITIGPSTSDNWRENYLLALLLVYYPVWYSIHPFSAGRS